METKQINIKKNNHHDHLLITSLILNRNNLNYTFSECSIHFRNYLAKTKSIKGFPELIKINKEVQNISSYPESMDGNGLFKTVYQYQNSVVQINLTYHEIWKFDGKPMMSSHDMPGKIVMSDDIIIDIHFTLKKETYQISLNKLNNAICITLPFSSNIKEEDIIELLKE